MRYKNRYAMPVHPKVLEQDFETSVDLNTLNEIYSFLKGKELDDISRDNFKEIGTYLEAAWYRINRRIGVNLRDREKLGPVFSEINRIFKGRKKVGKAYRGVGLSNFDPNALKKTYPNSINDPGVLEHLEGLAYGLRSWTDSMSIAFDWATGMGEPTNKDQVLFEIDNADIVLDSLNLNEYLKSIYIASFIDDDELVLNIKNPKIIDITQGRFEVFTVRIRDMG